METTVSFSPPPYPYERLSAIQAIASQHEGGAIECSIGTPIDEPPGFVVAELGRATGAKGYPPSAGTPAFRGSTAGWLHRSFGVDIEPDALAACVGTKEFVASLAGYLHLRSPNRDTVLYPEISYPTYAMGATLAGLRSVAVPVVDGRLQVDLISAEDVNRALVLWSNSPANPTGDLDDLATHAQWGRDHGVLVASDECYSEFTWADRPRSILEHGCEGVLAVHSISKRSNLAGVRAGFYAGDADVVAYLRLVRQHAGLMVPAPVQSAVALAYDDDSHVVEQRGRYLERLQLLVSALGQWGAHASMPDGSFYIWLRVPGLNGWEAAEELARVSGIVASPGELYGPTGMNYVRIAVVQPTERLQLAADRLIAAESVAG
jgi:succinyldiaminopimelate transaminase